MRDTATAKAGEIAAAQKVKLIDIRDLIAAGKLDEAEALANEDASAFSFEESKAKAEALVEDAKIKAAAKVEAAKAALDAKVGAAKAKVEELKTPVGAISGALDVGRKIPILSTAFEAADKAVTPLRYATETVMDTGVEKKQLKLKISDVWKAVREHRWNDAVALSITTPDAWAEKAEQEKAQEYVERKLKEARFEIK